VIWDGMERDFDVVGDWEDGHSLWERWMALGVWMGTAVAGQDSQLRITRLAKGQLRVQNQCVLATL